ncbi:tetratricopeptide repeat protein [Andreprevotia sp. IGB-42]|uniref:tetratricopeptide repeat protein n=1 Tax=Andreprevotia sp. IGB-42 TaxID=2497473 RepID=UPI00135BBBB3|nr:tetratricopeptide repeat protein [Andreprevotia sp. IGB-42]
MDDQQVLEQLPRRDNDALNAGIARLQQARLRAPQDMDTALKLAALHLQRFHRDADPRDLGRAEAVLAPWLAAQPVPPRVLLLRASVRQSNHHFPEAIADLRQVLAQQPGDAQALLMLASIHQVRGNYEEAKQSCGGLVIQDPPIASLCLGNVIAVSGQPLQGLALIGRGIDGLPPGGTEYLWALASRGETLAWLGRSAEAEQSFRAGLKLDSRDAYLKTALADLLLQQGRPAEVITLLRDDSRNDNLLLRLAIAEKHAGRSADLIAHVQDLKARFAAAAERGDRVHLREEARFNLELLNEAETALQLAEANWQVQKEVADCRLLLAAALAAGQPRRAAPALQWLRNAKLLDPQLLQLQRKLAGDVQPVRGAWA